LAEPTPPAPAAAPSRSLPVAISGWLLFVAVETATQICFKYAGAELDDRSGLVHLLSRALVTPVVLLGLGLYFLGFLIWMTILKNIDLGRAFPMTAIIYVSTLTSAVLLFHETLNATRIAGVLLIAAGVVLLASDPGAPKPHPGLTGD
jgi:drug/metabolite transporter (DMT)-like permease